MAFTIYLIYIINKALISFLDLILQGLRETAAQFRRQSQSLRQVRNFLYHIIYFILMAAVFAQSVKRVTAEREVAGSIPGPDQYSGS